MADYSVGIIEGFEVVESISFSNQLKKLHRSLPRLRADISTFLTAVVSLPRDDNWMRAFHVERLTGPCAGFLEAKRIRCSDLDRGSRSGVRLVFRIDWHNGRIDLEGIFLKKDSNVWLPSSPVSGRHRHSSSR